jgi:4-carboxymuconolactone decarboxylase
MTSLVVKRKGNS